MNFKLNFFQGLDCDFERWGFVETHHWLVVNIPGIDVDKGEVILSYLPPKYIKSKDKKVILIKVL